MKNNMGGGSYSYNTSIVRASNVYASMDRNEVFTSTSLNPQMDIKNKVRECVDSEEHPNAFPIIIGLDVTGSMGRIPYELITNNLIILVKSDTCYITFCHLKVTRSLSLSTIHSTNL